MKLFVNNFFLIVFELVVHKDEVLKSTSWFIYHSKMCVHLLMESQSWCPQTFSQIKVPIWIDLSYHSLILERSRRKIISTLGPILHLFKARRQAPINMTGRAYYGIQQDEHLSDSKSGWTKSKTKHIHIWQSVIFKNLPTHCQTCYLALYLTFGCPQSAPPARPRPTNPGPLLV